MHLISLWEVLGSYVTINIKHSYGHPNSELGRLKIKKGNRQGEESKRKLSIHCEGLVLIHIA